MLELVRLGVSRASACLRKTARDSQPLPDAGQDRRCPPGAHSGRLGRTWEIAEHDGVQPVGEDLDQEVLEVVQDRDRARGIN
jgi:hypothetical protein